MTIHFSDCVGLFEQALVVIPIIAFVFILFSAAMVLRNENEIESKVEGTVVDIFGVLVHVFTNKYLNSQGKKWQPIYSLSVIVCVGGFALSNFLGHCLP